MPSIVQRAKNFQIISDEQLKDGTDICAWIRQKLKIVEDRREFFVKPLRDHVNNINKWFKEFTVPLSEADKIVSEKMSAFRLKQQRAIEEKNRKLREQAEAKAEKKGVPVSEIPVKQVALPQKSVGSGSFRKVKDYEIIDETKIPRAYLEPNLAQIRKAVNAGITEIPGIRIFEKEIFSSTN